MTRLQKNQTLPAAAFNSPTLRITQAVLTEQQSLGYSCVPAGEEMLLVPDVPEPSRRFGCNPSDTDFLESGITQQ